MTDDVELTHTEQAMAYYANDLLPDEKAAFEKHLATCAECQKLLAAARAKLPMAEALLAFQPKRTIEAQVHRYDALREAELKRRARTFRYLGFALAAAIGVLFGIAAYVALSHAPRPQEQMGSPHP